MTNVTPDYGIQFKSICYTGLKPGPRLIILGAVHGNETCGTRAIRRVIEEIDSGRLHIAAGTLTLVPVANPLAYAHARREGDRNLNRNLYPTEQPADFEDHVANWLCPLLAQHEVLLDLHSFHTPGEAFVMLGPENNQGELEPFAYAAEEHALALHLGVHRFVDGWLDTYARGVERRAGIAGQGSGKHGADTRYGVGTTEYMRSVGGYALTLECGQHDDPQAPALAYRAILNTLAWLGLSGGPKPPAVAEVQALRIVDVIDKQHEADSFERAWASFDHLKAGDKIGTRQDGTPLVAGSDGFILFPNPKAGPGQEWFYLAKAQPGV